jgi:hypothetical protein
LRAGEVESVLSYLWTEAAVRSTDKHQALIGYLEKHRHEIIDHHPGKDRLTKLEQLAQEKILDLPKEWQDRAKESLKKSFYQLGMPDKMPSAYTIAKAGGKHKNFLRNYAKCLIS